MNEKDFREEFREFEHLFDIVEEPSHSKEQLAKLNQESNKEEWDYWYDRFLRYGGNSNDITI